MGDYIREEISIFLEAAFYGLIIAVAYDVLRIFRRVVRQGVIFVNIQDLLFWITSGIIIFAMIFQTNEGIVRGYIFIALFIGAYLYHKSVSSFFVKNVSKILNFFLTLLLKKPLRWAKMVKNRLRGARKRHGKYNDKEKKKRKTGNLRN